MAILQGSYERVMIWKEATRGTTPGTPVGHTMPLYDRSFDVYEEAPADVYELDGTPNPGQPGRGVLMADGTLTVPVDEAGFGLWLHVLCSSYSKSGASDPYSHTWKIGSTDPYSFGVELGNTGAAKYAVIPGCAVRGLTMTAEKTPNKLTATVDLVGLIAGAPLLAESASKDLTPDTYTSDRYNLFPSVVKVATVASTLIQRMTFNIRREVNAYHILDGNRYAKYCGFGPYTIDGEITGLWDDAFTLRSYAMSSAGVVGAEQNLEIVFTGMNANRDLTCTFKECTVSINAAPGLGGRDARALTVQFKAYKGNDADAPAKFVMRNAVADYAAIFTAA